VRAPRARSLARSSAAATAGEGAAEEVGVIGGVGGLVCMSRIVMRRRGDASGVARMSTKRRAPVVDALQILGLWRRSGRLRWPQAAVRLEGGGGQATRFRSYRLECLWPGGTKSPNERQLAKLQRNQCWCLGATYLPKSRQPA
jgi:hypothetical protein